MICTCDAAHRRSIMLGSGDRLAATPWQFSQSTNTLQTPSRLSCSSSLRILQECGLFAELLRFSQFCFRHPFLGITCQKIVSAFISSNWLDMYVSVLGRCVSYCWSSVSDLRRQLFFEEAQHTPEESIGANFRETCMDSWALGQSPTGSEQPQPIMS